MSEFGHLILAGIGAVMVVVAMGFRAWGAVAWLTGLNLVLHLYPVMLQRATRARLDRIGKHLGTQRV